MARFTYTAQRGDGDTYTGIVEADDRFEAFNTIRREGGHLLNIVEDTSAHNWLSLQYWNARFSTVPEQEKILFTRNLGSMIHAGLPLSRGLAVLGRQTKNQRLKRIIADLESDVRHGETFHAALSKFPRIFSKLVVAMVRAGEEGGDLPAALLVISEQMERSSDIKKKVRGALIYPAIIIVAIFGIGAIMMITVVPTLSQTFKEMNSKLPTSTQVIISISDFLSHHYMFALAGLVVLLVLLRMGLRTRTGRRMMDYTLIHMPLIGPMVKEVNAARTSRTLAALVTAGVDVLTALDISSEVVQNSYFRDVLKKAGKNVSAGQPLSATFLAREDLYPPFVGEMMSVGEETGQTGEMLKQLAVYYEAEVERKTKNMSTIIEPFLMIIIGAAVGFFAYSMIMPIYSVTQNI